MTTKTKAKRLPKSIVIIGRRWFRRGPGNTYCTAEIIVDGKTVHKTMMQGGYGDHYTTIAFDWLKQSGIIPPPADRMECHWRYIRDELGIEYNYQAIDVPRERDL